MSNLEDRRNSPRPQKPFHRDLLAIAIWLAFVAAALAGAAIGHALGVFAAEPIGCARIANSMPIAGDCR